MTELEKQVRQVIWLYALSEKITYTQYCHQPDFWFTASETFLDFKQFWEDCEINYGAISPANFEEVCAKLLSNIYCEYSIPQVTQVITQFMEYPQDLCEGVQPNYDVFVLSALSNLALKSPIESQNNTLELWGTSFFAGTEIHSTDRVLTPHKLDSLRQILIQESHILSGLKFNVFPIMLSFEEILLITKDLHKQKAFLNFLTEFVDTANPEYYLEQSKKIYTQLFSRVISTESPKLAKNVIELRRSSFDPIPDISLEFFSWVGVIAYPSGMALSFAEPFQTPYPYLCAASSISRMELDTQILKNALETLQNTCHSSIDALKQDISDIHANLQFTQIDLDQMNQFGTTDALKLATIELFERILDILAKNVCDLNQKLPSTSQPIAGTTLIAKMLIELGLVEGAQAQNAQRILSANWQANASSLEVAQRIEASKNTPVLMSAPTMPILEMRNAVYAKKLEFDVLQSTLTLLQSHGIASLEMLQSLRAEVYQKSAREYQIFFKTIGTNPQDLGNIPVLVEPFSTIRAKKICVYLLSNGVAEVFDKSTGSEYKSYSLEDGMPMPSNVVSINSRKNK